MRSGIRSLWRNLFAKAKKTGGIVFREPGQTHMLTNDGDTVYIGRIIELKVA